MAKASKNYEPDVTEKTIEDNAVKDVIDIDLSSIKKKKFRINGDNNLIIELNTSDMNIITRLEEATPKFQALEQKINELGNVASQDQGDSEAIAATAQALREVDKGMRDMIDFVFDSPIADKVSDGGTMYDVFGGKFRYEHVLDKFMALYEENLANEYRLMKKRVNKYAKK